jgi:hypothetical protein
VVPIDRTQMIRVGPGVSRACRSVGIRPGRWRRQARQVRHDRRRRALHGADDAQRCADWCNHVVRFNEHTAAESIDGLRRAVLAERCELALEF